MVEKEILQLLQVEEKYESKFQRAISKSKKFQEIALQEAKVAADLMQKEGIKNLTALKNNYSKQEDAAGKKIRQKAEQKIKIINECHGDLKILARKAAMELQRGLEENEN